VCCSSMATFEDNASSHSHHERHDGADDDVEDDDDCEFKLEPFSLNVVAANERFDSLRKIDCAQAFSSNVYDAQCHPLNDASGVLSYLLVYIQQDVR